MAIIKKDPDRSTIIFHKESGLFYDSFWMRENTFLEIIFKGSHYISFELFEKMEETVSKNDSFSDAFLSKEDKQNVKLILKCKNDFVELFKNNFESDDYLNLKKLESSFNFFLINSYYKYLKQISEESKTNNQKK